MKLKTTEISRKGAKLLSEFSIAAQRWGAYDACTSETDEKKRERDFKSAYAKLEKYIAGLEKNSFKTGEVECKH